MAVDVQTGAYKWHFQTIHHDLWDHDPPAPPALFDITRNGQRIPALAVTHEIGLPVHPRIARPDSRVRRRRACRAEERRAWRGGVADAADPGEAAGAGARHVRRRRSGDRGRHDTRTREGVRRTGAAGGRRLECRARSRRWRFALRARHSHRPCCSRAVWAAPTGAARRSILAPGTSSWSTQDVGALGSIAEGEGGIAGSLRQDHAWFGRDVRCPRRRSELAVPETAMGPAHRGELGHRRHRVAGPARHHRRSCPPIKPAHRPPGARRRHRDRRRASSSLPRPMTTVSGRSRRRPAGNCG